MEITLKSPQWRTKPSLSAIPGWHGLPYATVSFVQTWDRSNVPELKFPQWEGAWQEALLELDPNKLHDKIVVAEAAIFTRLQELSDDSDHHEERTVLGGAISRMRTLKMEILNFPDWKSR
jgi:hypothetical protein